MSSSRLYKGGIEKVFPLIKRINDGFWDAKSPNECHGAAVFPDGFGCGSVVSLEPKVPELDQPGGENVVLSVDKSGGTGFAFLNARDAEDAINIGGIWGLQRLADAWTADPNGVAVNGGGFTKTNPDGSTSNLDATGKAV